VYHLITKFTALEKEKKKKVNMEIIFFYQYFTYINSASGQEFSTHLRHLFKAWSLENLFPCQWPSTKLFPITLSAARHCCQPLFTYAITYPLIMCNGILLLWEQSIK
jgi:hypothetical protein